MMWKAVRLACASLAALALAAASFASAQSASPSAQAEAPRGGRAAVVRGLDKVSGKARDVTAVIGAPTQFGTLEITVRACVKSAPEDPPEAAAFLEVSDTPLSPPVGRKPGKGPVAVKAPIFSGWMMASSPALSPLEHPVYDIWVIDCRA